MTYTADKSVYSTAPIPTALRAGLRRARLRRRLSGLLMALAFLTVLVAAYCLSFPLFLLAAALGGLGARWSGQPVGVWVDTGPLEWF